MKPKILYSGLLLLIVAGLASCQNNAFTNPSPKLSSQYFPNSVGDSWTYAVSDTSGKVIDTLQVTVQRKTTLPDGSQANVWQYVSRDSSYTRYVVQQADSVFMYADSLRNKIKEKIVTPYKINSGWNLYEHSNAFGYFIEKLDTLTIGTGERISAYHTELLSPMTGPNSTMQEIWLSPYIGIVKLKQYKYGHYTIEDALNLISYHLK